MDRAVLEKSSHYVVGIDLGTTNSAMAYVDTEEGAGWRVRDFAVPQVVGAVEVEARETLPSFHYEAGAGECAARAGLPNVILVEEPQAAFYAWLHEHREGWVSQVRPGQKILVCDVGGGTSDFTLIRVRRASGTGVSPVSFGGTTIATSDAEEH